MTDYTLKVTKTGTVERSYNCGSCEIRALAYVRVKASGSTSTRSGGYSYDASKQANEEFQRRSVDILGLVQCPKCGERNSLGSMKFGIVFWLSTVLASTYLVWHLRETFLVMGPLLLGLWAATRLHRWWYLWHAAADVAFENIRATKPGALPKARALRK